jgi:CheY-like chemotaxis protein
MPRRNLIYVVDGDAAMRRSVARLLQQFGYVSLQFSSAEAFANHGDFDSAVCVILDINLGDGSGIELRQDLEAAGNTVPVIYMTGNDTPRRSQRCASFWLSRLSHQAVLSQFATRTSQQSIGRVFIMLRFCPHTPQSQWRPVSAISLAMLEPSCCRAEAP